MSRIPFIGHYYQQKNNIISYMGKLDNLITTNLNSGGIETRPAKSHGIWCFILLPAVLTGYTMIYETSTTYKLAAYMSIGLAFYCLLFMMFLTISSLVLNETQWGGCLQSGIVGCFLVYTFIDQGIWFSVIFTLPASYFLSHMLRTLLSYPKTFTIGEAMIVSQGFVIFVFVCIASTTVGFDDMPDFVDRIIITVLSTVGLIVTALSHLKEEQENVAGLLSAIAIGILIELAQLLLLGLHCIPTLIFFLFNKDRIQLVSFWMFLVLAAIVMLIARTRVKDCGRATTAMRKAFHVMAAVVFTSGVLLDLSLLKLAAGCGAGLIVLIEALRKSNIESVSTPLQAAFDTYCDEKDCGSFAMTPMYLYLGLAAPLWLVPARGAALERLAGVLAIGVGDSAASWFGSRYGSLKWPAGNRTVEGTLFNILSQIMFVYVLILSGLLEPAALARAALAAAASALVEARTEQVDNLILPLVSLLGFQFTHLILA